MNTNPQNTKPAYEMHKHTCPKCGARESYISTVNHDGRQFRNCKCGHPFIVKPSK